MIRRYVAALAFALTVVPAAARSDEPKFEFAKPEEVKEVVWKVAANFGLIYTTGNSQTLTVSGGLLLSRNDGKNKLVLELGGAFARADILTATDTNKNGVIDDGEVQRDGKITAQSWLSKLRYDRFLTENNALYLAAVAAGDVPAGKAFVVGGQAGYSRHLYQSKRQDLAGELGYDYSFVDYASDAASPKTVSIHSLRGFVGYNNALTPDTALALSIEALFNVNPLDLPAGHVGPFADVRLLGKASLTTKLWKNFSFRFAFTAKFDNEPAPLSASQISGVGSIPFAPGYHPTAEKLDTITEAAIIINFI